MNAVCPVCHRWTAIYQFNGKWFFINHTKQQTGGQFCTGSGKGVGKSL